MLLHSPWAGVLDYTPALNANLTVDDTGNTFAGVLQGKYRVYIDPYSANLTSANATPGNQYYVVGYKGTSPYDAGLFYCPYVPLQMVRAVGGHLPAKIGSRLATVSLRTPSLKAPKHNSANLTSMQTVTTDVLQLRTLCDILSLRVKEVQEGLRTLFFYLNT